MCFWASSSSLLAAVRSMMESSSSLILTPALWALGPHQRSIAIGPHNDLVAMAQSRSCSLYIRISAALPQGFRASFKTWQPPKNSCGGRWGLKIAELDDIIPLEWDNSASFEMSNTKANCLTKKKREQGWINIQQSAQHW